MARYLLFRTDRIGDFIFSRIITHAIKKNNSLNTIDVVCSKYNAKYVKNYRDLNKIYIIEKWNLKLMFENIKKINSKTFTENNMNKFFYYDGKQAVIDILNYKIFKSKKSDRNLIKLIEQYKNKTIPVMPIKAETIMNKYQIPEGKQLGSKLKLIEKEWVKNNFQITDQQVENIVKN